MSQSENAVRQPVEYSLVWKRMGVVDADLQDLIMHIHAHRNQFRALESQLPKKLSHFWKIAVMKTKNGLRNTVK